MSDRADALVIGAGVQPSGLRVLGGGDDSESVELRSRAAALGECPVVVPMAAGVAVVGSAVLAAAVARGLVVQLCLALPPGELRITGALGRENVWAERMPHRRAVTGLRLSMVGPGESLGGDVDVPIVCVEPGEPPPPRCRVVVTVTTLARASVDFDGEIRQIALEALGTAQARVIAQDLTDRAGRSFGDMDGSAPVQLAPLLANAPTPRHGGLAAVIGLEDGAPCVIDLVADGPHAVVAGVTGSGKSELLVTWILSMCAAHPTSAVSFLLADFKGGSAFDALAGLPHVTGVLTDLDGTGARRAIESLRAEVRWREAELARCGARDILDPRVDMPRLIVVVDEFAALLSDHPELHAIFTDLAARGRALGLHLVLGTQRPAGVVRESLLANCPLRISLRVSDANDSRAIIGTTGAAELPGGMNGRGHALLRTASDGAPRRVRIALSTSGDAASIAALSRGPRPRRPWLPELPVSIALDDLRPRGDGGADAAGEGRGEMLMGLADDPERQRQHPIGISVSDRGLLIIGGAGSGKSTALRTLSGQVPRTLITVPPTTEGAWDAVVHLSEHLPERGSVIVIDDVDAISARLEPDYARELTDRLERIARATGDAGILLVASTQRLAGGAARLADLLPRRLVLATPTRADHVAAGGDPAHHVPNAAPGRGRLDGLAVQVAVAAPATEPPTRRGDPTRRVHEARWHPSTALTGFVARRSPATRSAVAAWERHGAHPMSLEDFVADGEWPSDHAIVVVGEPDEWQRHWRALSTIRADHDLVVDTACAGELRLLTGHRTLPPYCEPHQNRAWLFRAGGEAVRVVLPGDAIDDRSGT